MDQKQYDITFLLNEGRRQFLAGHLDSAMLSFNHAVTLKPNDFIIQRNIGMLFMLQNQHMKAMKHLSKAVELNEFDALTKEMIAKSRSCLTVDNAQSTGANPGSKYFKGDRLLVVYDLEAHPCSIGDFLNFLQGALVVAQINLAKTIDICFISNPSNPTTPDLIHIFAEDSRFCHLFSILPITQLAGNIGSVSILESLEEALNMMNHGYLSIWPNLDELHNKKYMFYEIMKLCSNYKIKHGVLPHLSCRRSAISWARSFYDTYASPEIMVSINLRNNPKYHSHRNSNLGAWFSFIEHCLGKYPVKFVIICGITEIDDCFRQLENVIIAKDYFTDIEQDLALIQFSAMHIGAASGPATMATFTENPYLIVNADMGNYLEYYEGALKLEAGFLYLAFGNKNQRFGTIPETAGYLIGEFEYLWTQLDSTAWLSSVDEIEPIDTPLTWLR